MNDKSPSHYAESIPLTLRRLFRGLAIIVLGTLSGAAFGFVLFLLLNSAWDTLSDWQNASIPQRSSRGGDPIGSWARGYVRMFYCFLLMIPFTAQGLFLGVRVALLDSINFRQLCKEVGKVLSLSTAIFFSTNELWGSCCLIQAILFWPVGILGGSTLGHSDSPAIILLLLSLIIVSSIFCGLKGLSSTPKNKSISGLIITTLNTALLCWYLVIIGLDRIL